MGHIICTYTPILLLRTEAGTQGAGWASSRVHGIDVVPWGWVRLILLFDERGRGVNG